MDVVVFGAGSLGSLVGGLLARAHEVTLVGRDPHVTAVGESGLRVTGADEFRAHPGATTDGTGLAADLAVVTVKAFDTDAAAGALATGTYGAVLSLQNGMGNEETLAAALDCPVLAGTISHGAILTAPGTVEWTGRGDVTLGPWEPGDAAEAARVGDAFREAGIEVAVVRDVRYHLWEKLAVNAAINPVTALARVENGAIRTAPASALAREAAVETARVARAEGIDLDDVTAASRAEAVAEATAVNRSSMLQDVEAGRRTEIDAISGYVLDRAATHDLDTPANRSLATLVRAWEAGRGLR